MRLRGAGLWEGSRGGMLGGSSIAGGIFKG